MRFFLGLAFILLYIGWVVYRSLIKKDIKQHKGDLYALSFFTGTWVVIYCAFYFF